MNPSTTLTSKCTLAGATRSAPRQAPAAAFLSHLFSSWLRRARERRDLQALDDSMLKDIGISRADIEFEVSKPFWMP